MEKALIEGNIQVADLRALWNERYKTYLEIEVPSDREGILQDVHWSHGMLGYFPTYSIGSFYAAQFYQQAKQDVANLEEKIQKGNMQPLLDWLRTNIHQHGKTYSAKEICKKVTGQPLNFSSFMQYVEMKYEALYR